MSQATKDTNVVTPVATLSYPALFEPRAVLDADGRPTGPEKYSATLVWAPGTDLSSMKKLALQLAIETFGKTAPEQIKVGKLRWPFRGVEEPGADMAGDDTRRGWEAGSTWMNVRSNNPPLVASQIPDPSNDNNVAFIVNAAGDVRLRDGTVIPKAREVYAGCQVIAAINAYTYSMPQSKGITFGLNHIQVVGDGPRLDGRVDATNVFEADMNLVTSLSAMLEGASDETADEGETETEVAGDESPTPRVEDVSIEDLLR